MSIFNSWTYTMLTDPHNPASTEAVFEMAGPAEAAGSALSWTKDYG